MTIAYWCILAAILLPYLATVIAKVSGGGFDRAANANPRVFLTQLQGLPQRANSAQLNGFEAAPAFAAAVIVAHLTGQAAQATIDLLAIGWVISRLLYLVCYLADWPRPRSMVWAVGLVIIIALFVIAA